MSELPEIDPLTVANKNIEKLEAEVKGYRNQVSTLEALAEAIRDQRDAYKKQLDETPKQPVQDISSLPPA